jgi:hypothetical protein
MSKLKRKSKGPYVAVPIAIMSTTAWRTMSPGARLLWIELRSRLRNDGLNNGKIHRSCRVAAKAIGAHRNTVARQYAENEHYGFLRKTGEGFLGSDGRGIAARYRFTDLAYGTHAATRDYEAWDGSTFEYTPPRPSRKKRKPVPFVVTPRHQKQDIRKAGNGGAVCHQISDIGESPKCHQKQDISSLPLGERPQGERMGERASRIEQEQGSSTVRAPAQAGGAGSSPAPDANRRKSLTAYVLSVVNAELEGLHARMEVARTLWPKASK